MTERDDLPVHILCHNDGVVQCDQFPHGFGAELELGFDSDLHALVVNALCELHERPHRQNPLHGLTEKYGVLVLRELDFLRTPLYHPKWRDYLSAEGSATDLTFHFDLGSFYDSPTFTGFFAFEGWRQSQTYFSPLVQAFPAFKARFSDWIELLKLNRFNLIHSELLASKEIDYFVSLNERLIDDQPKNEIFVALLLIRDAISSLMDRNSVALGFQNSLRALIYATLHDLEAFSSPVIIHYYRPKDVLLVDDKQVLHGRLAATSLSEPSDPLGHFNITQRYPRTARPKISNDLR